MPIKTELFNKNDLPGHLIEEIQEYVDAIFTYIAPLMKDKQSLNYLMSALSWVSFLCIKEFVADHYQQKAVLHQAQTILNNLEEFKDRDFLQEAKKKWEEENGMD